MNKLRVISVIALAIVFYLALPSAGLLQGPYPPPGATAVPTPASPRSTTPLSGEAYPAPATPSPSLPGSEPRISRGSATPTPWLWLPLVSRNYYAHAYRYGAAAADRGDNARDEGYNTDEMSALGLPLNAYSFDWTWAMSETQMDMVVSNQVYISCPVSTSLLV